MATKLRGERPAESLQMRLGANTSAPQRARRAVEALDGELSPQAIADLCAVVTELIGIFLSSQSDIPIEIRLELRGGRVRGEVLRADGVGVGLSGPGCALRILGALVEEWGIAADAAGAWFECLDSAR